MGIVLTEVWASQHTHTVDVRVKKGYSLKTWLEDLNQSNNKNIYSNKSTINQSLTQ